MLSKNDKKQGGVQDLTFRHLLVDFGAFWGLPRGPFGYLLRMFFHTVMTHIKALICVTKSAEKGA